MAFGIRAAVGEEVSSEELVVLMRVGCEILIVWISWMAVLGRRGVREWVVHGLLTFYVSGELQRQAGPCSACCRVVSRRDPWEYVSSRQVNKYSGYRPYLGYVARRQPEEFEHKPRGLVTIH